MFDQYATLTSNQKKLKSRKIKDSAVDFQSECSEASGFVSGLKSQGLFMEALFDAATNGALRY